MPSGFNRSLKHIYKQAMQFQQLNTPDLLENMPLMTLLGMSSLVTSTLPCKNFTCAIINVKSGACTENCAFCAQSAHYTTNNLAYPFLQPQQILAKVEAKLQQTQLDYLGLVSSGPALTDDDFNLLCQSAKLIHSRFRIQLCASVGFLTPQRARALKQAGFISYHHNLETARSYFNKICTTHHYQQRVDTIKVAKAEGLRVCCGGLFGLGESFKQRCELAAQVHELAVDSIPINFLIPIKGTPLENQKTISPAEALRTIAMFRLFNPGKDVVICGGRLEALKSLKNMVFSAGANGLMLGDYLTRKGGEICEDLWEMSMLEVI